MATVPCLLPTSVPAHTGEGSLLWDTLQRHAAARPATLALVEPDGPALSWTELLRRVDLLTAQLKQSGLTPSHTVAVMLPDGAQGLIAMLAVMRVCACSVLDPASTAEELRTDLQAISAAAIIFAPQFFNARQVAAQLGLVTWVAHPKETLLYPQTRPSLQAPSHHHAFALLLQTSATTGRRKVVPLTLTKVMGMAANTAQALQLTSHDRLLVMARPFHILGSLSALAQLSVGGTVMLPPQLSAAAFPGYLRDFRPTWYTAGPTTHRAILQQFASGSPAGPQSLRLIRSGGSTMPQSLRESLTHTFGVPVADGYGLTETGPVTSIGYATSVSVGSVGHSVGPEVAIMSPAGEILAAGQQGEIVVRGPAVCEGYLNDPEATAQAFHHDWFRTGDLGLLDSSGQLFLSGRIKEIINRGGQKIIPNEIDAALSTHPAVQEAVAFGAAHRTLGEDVECAVILKADASVLVEELRTHLRAALAPYKIPRRIHFVTSIPRGATGKPRRAALRDLLATSRPEPRDIPRTDVPARNPEAQGRQPFDYVDVFLLELWAEALQLPHATIEDDFFQVGGDSLAAISLLARLETEFQLPRKLSIERFIETPTPAALMIMLEEAVNQPQETPGSSIVYPLASALPGGRLFLIPANTGKGLYFRRLARHLRAVCPVSLVIPEERAPFRALYPIEDAARHAVSAIRQAQPSGPYLVGGYCHGGVVAFEVAAQLEQQGQTVRLILFDTPSPLIPSSLSFLGAHSREKLARVRTRRSFKPLIAAARMVGRRTHWFVLRHTRPILQRTWHLPLTERFFKLSNPSLIAFYHPPVLRSDILHLLAAAHQHAFRAQSRLGWASKTSGRVTNQTVAGDHESLFAEAHLPVAARHISDWL